MSYSFSYQNVFFLIFTKTYTSIMKNIILLFFISLSLNLYAQNKSATQSIDAILNEMLYIISAEKGESRDLEALRNLFLPEATFAVLSSDTTEPRYFEMVNLDEFIQSLEDEYYKNGFEESELGKVVHEFNGIASVFQSFYGKDSEGNQLKGINSIQLVYKESRWWIAHTLWTFETDDIKIPPIYMDTNIALDSETFAFSKRGINGCMVLYNLNETTSHNYNIDRVDSAFLPASTFKIINSLIALEEAVVESIYDTIKWDGVNRNWDKWNQDHTLASALKYSAVWFYQELARRVGRENYQKWLNKCDYGNHKTGDEIDTFWLDGDVRISTLGQIRFLEKLINNELPFSTRNQELVKQIMLTDSTNDYQVYSKTGWAMRVDQQIGWLVGFVVTKTNTWIFACNIDIEKDSDAKYRKEIVYEILQEKGIVD